MQRITKTAAETALEKLDLTAQNRAFAGHWLSLWAGDELPRLERFNYDLVRELVPDLVEFESLPERRVMVRNAGRETCQIVGNDLNGIDWIMYAAIRIRRLRLRNFDTIAQGAIMIAHRRLAMVSGPAVFNQELVLPFAPRSDGIHPVVAHVDWKIDRALRFTGIAEIENLAHDHKVLTIRSRAPRRRRQGTHNRADSTLTL